MGHKMSIRVSVEKTVHEVGEHSPVFTLLFPEKYNQEKGMRNKYLIFKISLYYPKTFVT